MTPRERIMTALALKEPDCVPFADWVEDFDQVIKITENANSQVDDLFFCLIHYINLPSYNKN